MKLKDLIKSVENHRIYPAGGNSAVIPDLDVSMISCNSRENLRDAVFIAVKGAQADGHAFIQDAIRRQAAAVVFEDPRRISSHEIRSNAGACPAVLIQVPDSRKAMVHLAQAFYGYPSRAFSVIGITGTNGKTTISYLVEAIVRRAGNNPAVIGTVNYRYNQKVIASGNTTPGPIELQRLFKEMFDGGVTHLAMEVSSHALDQDRVAGINFSGAIFTNLTQDHLDYHKGLEEYFQAKAKLFTNLEKDAFPVINNDDPYGRRLVQMCDQPVVTYGLNDASEVYASDVSMDTDHTDFTINGYGRQIKIRMNLIGRHNVYNVLGAAAWAMRAGTDPAVIASAVEGFTSVPGRLERIEGSGGIRAFVDYAHTEDALSNVISTLRQITGNKIIVVFGCGGDRDKMKRPKMGRVVTDMSDYAVITSDNPRSEDPQAIIDDIIGGITKKNYCVIPDRMSAIRTAVAKAEEGDVVLIAGKGHETYQIVKDVVLHFDDREAVKECLKSRN